MRSSRFAALTATLALSALLGCATTDPVSNDGAVGPGEGPDAAEPGVDASPGPPDGPAPPDAGAPDAAPDASITHPDAALPAPDASAPSADAAPVCTTVDLLQNGNFDSGPGATWSETSSGGGELVRATSALQGHTPHSGGYAAWLGGYNAGDDQMYQQVTIPANATNLHFKGQRWIETQENATTIYDRLSFELMDPAGATVLESVGGSPAFSNLSKNSAWAPFDLAPAGNYAGQTVRLRIHGTTDNTAMTSFFLDTLVLEATVCQ